MSRSPQPRGPPRAARRPSGTICPHETHPDHRRHRIHRRPAGPATGRGAIGSAAWPATRGSSPGGAGEMAWRSSPATCWTATRSARRWRAAAPRITWSTRWPAARGSFDERDRRGRRELRRGRRRGRARADHLPGRPGPAGRASSRTTWRAATRSATSSEPGTVPVDRAARRDDHRLGQRLVRDAPRAGRAAPGDDLPAMGRDPHPADRDPRRPGLPDRLPGEPGDRRAGPSTSAGRTS